MTALETYREEVRLTSGPHELAATVVGPRGVGHPGPAILFLHGMASNRRGYLARAERAAADLGATCLALDLSGHGASTGRLPEIAPHQHLADVVAGHDALLRLGAVDAARVGVCGSSYGGFLAAWLTGSRPTARLLVRAPTIVADRYLDRPLRERVRDRSPESASRWRGALGAFAGPVLVLESEHDEVIPHAVIEAYLSTAPHATHRILRGAAHALTDPRWRAAFEAELVEFFADL